MLCYHVETHVIMWDEMLSCGTKWYHLELMLSCGSSCYHMGLNSTMWRICYVEALVSCGTKFYLV
jgi:hypothetical protein